MRSNSQSDLVSFTGEIMYGKLHFLCSENCLTVHWTGQKKESRTVKLATFLTIISDLKTDTEMS